LTVFISIAVFFNALVFPKVTSTPLRRAVVSYMLDQLGRSSWEAVLFRIFETLKGKIADNLQPFFFWLNTFLYLTSSCHAVQVRFNVIPEIYRSRKMFQKRPPPSEKNSTCKMWEKCWAAGATWSSRANLSKVEILLNVPVCR
jgi:hypothetical protein